MAQPAASIPRDDRAQLSADLGRAELLALEIQRIALEAERGPAAPTLDRVEALADALAHRLAVLAERVEE